MKRIKQAFLLFQMRSLEAVIDGQSACLDLVRDPYTINQIIIAQINARNELRKVRMEYRALKSLSVADNWRMSL